MRDSRATSLANTEHGGPLTVGVAGASWSTALFLSAGCGDVAIDGDVRWRVRLAPGVCRTIHRRRDLIGDCRAESGIQFTSATGSSRGPTPRRTDRPTA
jgi:hypothetical protein